MRGMISGRVFTFLADLTNGKIPIGNGSGDVNHVGKAGANTLITSILSQVYMWAGIVCVLIIVIAGLMYATSNGDSNQVARAKNAIIASIAGLVVVTSAFIITDFVIGKF